MKKLVCILVAFVVIAAGAAYAYEKLPEYKLLRVDGDNMSDTICNGETIVCIAGADVNRGDVVIYDMNGTGAIGRIVAVTGDKVYRENGVTHIVYDYQGELKDEALDERYALFSPNGSTDDYEPYTLGENEYFVVGDNRYNSRDSRDWKDAMPENDIGPIGEEAIIYAVIGKAK